MPISDNEAARLTAVLSQFNNAPVAIPCGCNYTWGMHGQPVLRPCPAHLAARCVCPTVWHGIVPPPPCPVHPRRQMMTVIC